MDKVKYSNKIIEFFKKHNLYDEEMFDYFQNNTIMMDYRVEEDRAFVGCYCTFKKINNKDSNILDKILLVIPYDYNDKTRLVSIHEIVHGICAYKKLNNYFLLEKTCEVLPFLFEKIYALENPSDELNKYIEYLDSCITQKSDNKYKIALALRDELIAEYEDDFDKMEDLSNRLALKYTTFNR